MPLSKKENETLKLKSKEPLPQIKLKEINKVLDVSTLNSIQEEQKVSDDFYDIKNFNKILNDEIDNSDKSFTGFFLALIKTKKEFVVNDNSRSIAQPEIMQNILNSLKKFITAAKILGMFNENTIGILVKNIALDVIMKESSLRQYISFIFKEITKEIPSSFFIEYCIYPIDAITVKDLLTNLKPI